MSPRILICLLAVCLPLQGQQAPSAPSSLAGTFQRPLAFLEEDEQTRVQRLERRFLLHLATDQVELVKGAGRFRTRDLRWAVPLVATGALTLSTDSEASRKLAGNDPSAWRTSRRITDAGLFASGALAGGMYLWGRGAANAHLRETGLLAGQAMTAAWLDTQVTKNIFRRQRPGTMADQGRFFVQDAAFPSDASFPSGHAMTSWAVASVIAHEYPGWLTQAAVYGLAALTSVPRITAKKHFPSDVLIGSALGWYIGRQVYRAHHDPELGGADIGRFVKDEVADPNRRSIGSTYVPLDSWVYGAFDRLAGMGMLRTNLSNMRPWTRLECARLLHEAESEARAVDAPDDSVASALVRELRREFAHESEILDGSANRSAAVEQLYARAQGISGTPLRDGYHFGQTVYNDFGRPFAEGVNLVSGGSAYAARGPWSVYFRAELQHSPSAPALPLTARSAIAALEGTPLETGAPFREINRARVLDAYAAFTWRKFQFSFGKQSLWWAPNHEGALNYSNNAEPVNMFRVSNVHPLDLPWIFKYLGPAKGEFFLGQLEGHRYMRTSSAFFGPPLPRQPYIEGLKVAFKPTQNFEFGVSVTSVWGGAGIPITWTTFRRSFSPGNVNPGLPLDPGDRRTGFDLKYRVPGLRRWLTIYNDAMAEDEFSPIGYPRRSAHAPGIYLSRIPGIEKLDFRGEGYWTDLPGLINRPGTWYHNNLYLSGYTNEGFLLGHPVGRQGSGFTVKSTYWFTPLNTISGGYRHVRAARFFLQGGTIDDYFARGSWKVSDKLSVDGRVQYENWRFPLLSPGRRNNVSVTFEVKWAPGWTLGKPAARSR